MCCVHGHRWCCWGECFVVGSFRGQLFAREEMAPGAISWTMFDLRAVAYESASSHDEVWKPILSSKSWYIRGEEKKSTMSLEAWAVKTDHWFDERLRYFEAPSDPCLASSVISYPTLRPNR